MEFILVSGFLVFVVRVIVLGCFGIVVLGFCGIVFLRGVGFNFFLVGVMFLFLVVIKFELEVIFFDIGIFDEGNILVIIGMFLMGVGILFVDFFLERDIVIIFWGMVLGVFVGVLFVGVIEVLFFLFLSIGGDKVCFKVDGVVLVLEFEVILVFVLVFDDFFG